MEWKDATIHIASHVIHYGSGVFEGARCYATPRGRRASGSTRTCERLCNSAKIYRMDYPLDLARLAATPSLDTIRANEMKACYIRPLVYRGYEPLGVNPLPFRSTPRSWCGNGAPTSARKRSRRAST